MQDAVHRRLPTAYCIGMIQRIEASGKAIEAAPVNAI